jgi:membrane protease YdiL (CAAX protease family)
VTLAVYVSPVVLVTALLWAIALLFPDVYANWFGYLTPDDFGGTTSATGAAYAALTIFMWIGLIWLAAGRQRARTHTLLLGLPRHGWGVSLFLGVALFVISAGLVLILEALGVAFDTRAQDDLLKELRSPWWLALIFYAVVLGPICEELTFRGFLSTALAQTRVGRIGATLLTSAAWTGIHWNLTGPDLAITFASGVFLSWLVWRTGSIHSSIEVHAVYNAICLAGLSLSTPP